MLAFGEQLQLELFWRGFKMQENREVLFAAAGNFEMMSTDDVTGRKSGLAQSVEIDTLVQLSLLATTVAVDFEVQSGSRTVARGRCATGGTIGVFPTPDRPQVEFVCFRGEELSVFVTNATGTPSVMMTIEREAA